MLNRINLEEQQAKARGAGPTAMPVPVKALERLAFPIELKDTSLQSALELIRQQVETTTGGKTQVNFVLQLPPELANKKVTLRLNHVPVTEMLRYIGDLAGVAFQVQRYAIMVLPKSSAPTSADAVGASPHP